MNEKKKQNILKIRDLVVKVENTVIVDGINLSLKAKESYILFGPNGSGKTTLVNVIMGIPSHEIVSGNITFLGKNLIGMDVDKRSKLGISVGFQHPPEISGVKLSDLLKLCLGQNSKYLFSSEEKKLIDSFKLTEFLDRDINVDFSGGERKRVEILQMLLLKPKLLLLDEPDSGVDVESLKLIATEIQRYSEKNESSILIVTHNGGILEYIKAKYACVLLNGKMHCYANPRQIYENIQKSGYEKCVTCRKVVTEEPQLEQ